MDNGWNRLTTNDGNVYFKRTGKNEKLFVPSSAACRERLIQLLESVDGDRKHENITQFWNDRANAMHDLDQMKSAYAAFVYDRLVEHWDILTNVPPRPELDIFSVLDPQPDDWHPEPLTPEEESWFSKQPESKQITAAEAIENALNIFGGKSIEPERPAPEPPQDIFSTFGI